MTCARRIRNVPQSLRLVLCLKRLARRASAGKRKGEGQVRARLKNFEMIRGAEAGKESREDGAPEEIEEGAAWGEGAAPAVEQGKKKKEPGETLVLGVRRERRETLSLSYPQAFQFFIGMPGGNPRQRRFPVIRTSSKLTQLAEIFDPYCHTHGTLARYFLRKVLIDKS